MTSPANSGRLVEWLAGLSAGVIACVLADMTHEALGHGVVSALTGDRILSISTVALQNESASRLVSSAGTTANLVAGWIALTIYRRMNGWTAGRLCLWLFAAFNLLNAGYFVVSAILNSGDWANVIAGLSPAWLWRAILGLGGAGLYVASVRALAATMIETVENGAVTVRSLRRAVLAAYLGGGAVMTAAAVFNPIDPSLILMSGAGASFGLNAGLLFVPGIVADHARKQPADSAPAATGLAWIAAAVVIGGVFIAVLGPGLRFPG